MTIREEIDPYVMSPRGLVGLNDEATLNTVNAMIARATDCTCQTPYIALERVRKILSTYHVNLPKYTLMDADEGNVVFTVSQFGEKFGYDQDGDVSMKNNDGLYLYFEYVLDDDGGYSTFAEVVDAEDLSELLDDYNSDEEEDSDEGEMEDEDEDEGPEMMGQGQDQSYDTNYDEHKGLKYA